MKMKILLATASIACLGLATSASAHDDNGWYLRGNAGYGAHTDIDLSGDVTSEQHGNGLQSEGNVAGSLGLGYDFGNNWRLELDGASLFTDFGSISQIPSTAAKLRTNTAMLNALYDFDDFGRWSPYVGAGVGLVQGKIDIAAQDFLAPLTVANPACLGTRSLLVNRDPGGRIQAENCNVSDSDTAFGYQLLAGLGYDLSDNIKWDTQYRYLDSGRLDFDGVRTNRETLAQSAINVAAAGVGAHTLMTGFRYLFGHKHTAAIVPPPPPPPPVRAPEPVIQYIDCPDGSVVTAGSSCPVVQPQVNYINCPDGSVVVEGSSCPIVQPQVTYVNCPDGSVVVEGNSCPIIQPTVVASNLNVCGASNVGIFNVNTSATPKQMSRLGTLPEFGDSHGLSADQFFQKLQNRYNTDATDKAYLNYLFKSMGYSNGFADAQSYMFSEDVLPVGTAGLLGLGKQHHYNYSILPSNDRDRQAFRIQSANGVVVHFMKTCGNYFYGCE